MADPKKTRLKRFGKWTPEHKDAVLKAAGVDPMEFRAMSRGEKRATVNKGIDAQRLRSAQLDSPDYFVRPLTTRDARQQAGNAANLVYGGPENLADEYARSVDPWFDDYMGRTQQRQQAQQQAAAPIITQAQQQAQQSGQTVLNADPNSSAAQDDALAAASRKAMGDLFANLLAGQQTATNTQYTQQAGAVEASRLGEHTTANQQRQQIAREKGQFRNQTLSELRDKAHTERLENKAFDLNVGKAQASIDAEANEVNQYGVKNSTWSRWSASHRKRWIADFKKDTAAPQSPKAPKYVYGMPEGDFYKLPRAKQLEVKAEWETAGDSPKSSTKDKFGNTPAQRRTNNNYWESALETLRTDRPLITDPQAVSGLTNDAGIPHDIAQVAVYWARNKANVTPKMARTLLRLGIRVSPQHIRRPRGSGGPNGNGRL